jgi:hypothetical protein
MTDETKPPTVTIDPDLARRKAEAEALLAIAEAEQKTAVARQAQRTAALPDLTKVTVKETTRTGDVALGAPLVAHGALTDVATDVARQALPWLPGDEDSVVLVTTEADLSTADAVHHEVSIGLDALLDAAQDLLDALSDSTEPSAPGDRVEPVDPADAPVPTIDGGRLPPLHPLLPLAPAAAGLATVAAPILTAAASALPGLVSLLQSKTAVRTAALTVDETAVVAAVAGALARGVPATRFPQGGVQDTDGDGRWARQVWIDGFRRVPDGRTAARERRLRDRRSDLVTALRGVEQQRAVADGVVAARTADRDAAKAAATAAGDDADTATAALRTAGDALAVALGAAARWRVASETITSLLGTIDAFVATLHTVPTGATRSAAVDAALHEALHPADGDERSVAAVLFLHAVGGSTEERYDDRPVRSDRYETVATLSVAWWALDLAADAVVAAGVEVASTVVRGEVGRDPDIRRLRPT